MVQSDRHANHAVEIKERCESVTALSAAQAQVAGRLNICGILPYNRGHILRENIINPVLHNAEIK